MKLNKFKTIAPAAALLLAASMSSCMDDLNKGNIDPTVDPNPNITGLYSKCYAGLIMEGNDGNADFTIEPFYATCSTSTRYLPTKQSAGGRMAVSQMLATISSIRVMLH